jgi:hypothetical protein
MASPTGSVSCSLCGSTAPEAPISWMMESDPRRGQVWVCDRCARENVRAIESKLDRAWW